jgi:hypothetical protein
MILPIQYAGLHAFPRLYSWNCHQRKSAGNITDLDANLTVDTIEMNATGKEK